jgi:hypothetical protein
VLWAFLRGLLAATSLIPIPPVSPYQAGTKMAPAIRNHAPERTPKMRATKNGLTKKERKNRRKKILRLYREDQQAIIWNKVMDEVGICDLAALEEECCSPDFPIPFIDQEFQYSDEDYPNKTETLHNIFECD